MVGEHFNEEGVVTRREVCEFTGSNASDQFLVTRNTQSCVQDDSAETRTKSQVPQIFES